jgi:uncharacterized protein (TIGR02598 family)
MQKLRGFSLVEITVAIGIIGFALIAILGLIPVAQNSAREAADDTKLVLIQQDIYNRVRAALSSATVFANASTVFPNPPTSPNFYYTNDGIFFSDSANLTTALTTAKQNGEPLPNYAATVVIGAGFANPLPNVNATYLKPVTVKLGWPLDSNGSVVGPMVGGVQPNAARKKFGFYIRKS